jgi:uncharacterized protein (DUF302 family)
MTYYFSRSVEAPFAEAIARTKEALSKHGFGVLCEIDVAATMKAKLSADMPPYVILGACSPRHAFKALQAEPHIGSMLPCNVIVREEAAGRVEVAAVDPIASMQAVDNPALAEVAADVQGLLREVVAAI